jgi:hypothetical protein
MISRASLNGRAADLFCDTHAFYFLHERQQIRFQVCNGCYSAEADYLINVINSLPFTHNGSSLRIFKCGIEIYFALRKLNSRRFMFITGSSCGVPVLWHFSMKS